MIIVFTSLLLALCLSGAVAQTTQSPFSCYLENASGMSENCLSKLADTYQANGVLNFDAVGDFCSSYCAVEFNDTLMDTCQLAFIEGLCSMDDYGLCLAQNATEFGVMVGEVITGPCYGTNCSDATCNSAVQNLTCCIGGISKVTEIIGIDIDSQLLPSDCAVPECMNTLGGGAPMLVAMPLAVMMSLLLALFAAMMLL